MAEFIYQEPFPVGEDKTQYRLLTKDYVKVVECDGRKILKVDPAGLEFRPCRVSSSCTHICPIRGPTWEGGGVLSDAR